MDRIQDYGKHVREVENRIDIVEHAKSQAEGVGSALAGTFGGGSNDTTELRYVSLCEDADRLSEEWAEADDLRQNLMECIGMVPDDHARLVLTAALRDAQLHGRVVKARIARRLGCSERTAARDYDDALAMLEAVMREHGCL